MRVVVLFLILWCSFFSEAHPGKRSVLGLFGLAENAFSKGPAARVHVRLSHDYALFHRGDPPRSKSLHEQCIQASFPNNPNFQQEHLKKSLDIHYYLTKNKPMAAAAKEISLGYGLPPRWWIPEDNTVTTDTFHGIGYAAPGDRFIDKVVPIEHALVPGFLKTLFQWEGFSPDLYYVRVPIGVETRETIVSFGAKNDFLFSWCEPDSFLSLRQSNVVGKITAILFSYVESCVVSPLLKSGTSSEDVASALSKKGVLDKFSLNELDGFFV